MKLHRIWAVILRHAWESRHNWNRIAEMVYWPVQNIVVWGFFTVYLARDHHLRPGMVNFLLGAAILWGMFYAFQRDLATGFLEELWSRNLANLFSTPLSISEYLTGLTIVNLFKAMIGMLAAALTACVFNAYDIFPRALELIPFMLVLAVFALAVGVIIIGLILRYTTKIQTLAWSFAGLLMPFSCVFYPLSSLPKYLRPISWALPTTHVFEGMRQTIALEGFSMVHFGWGISLDALYYVLAILIFRRMFESARSRGLLVKLE
jgi:ABC-2 type transport system permease protein